MRTTEAMAEALIEMRRQPGCDGQDQFWQIAERYRAGLVNHALAILGSQSDAQDVAQDNLCRAFLDQKELDRTYSINQEGFASNSHLIRIIQYLVYNTCI